MSALLEIEGLTISSGRHALVDDLTLSVSAGERLALVGESGSGKTLTALSILRLVAGLEVRGNIRLGGQDLLSLPEHRMREIRGRDVAMIFQEPMTALNPLYTIGNQIAETLALHERLRGKALQERVLALLTGTGLRDPEQRVNSYPHQLSGGQRQRAMIAMAMACSPKLLIADEPTTALDVTIRARIVARLLDLQQRTVQERGSEGGMAVLLITHDLPLVKRFAQRVAVIERGRIVEVAPTEQLFADPQHPYTRRLLQSVPVRDVAPLNGQEKVVLQASGIQVEYRHKLARRRLFTRHAAFRAVQNVDFTVHARETVGIVGESGSGKSTLAMVALGLLTPNAGKVQFCGRPLEEYRGKLRHQLRSRLQIVFQDPFGSLSPRRTIAQIVGEGLQLHRPDLGEQQRFDRVVAALAEVGLPHDCLQRYPHEFSGGQRQRIAIARSLIVEPQVIVLDEPTSALDISIQKQVLELLSRLQRKYELSYVLITHDLAVVRAMAHQVLVMKDGQVVERGEALDVMDRPQHEYTRQLVGASQ
ncbi:MAG: dipeptide ABC transporter ATP-binding protein [Gammaproteobacteria bacterium]